MTYNQSNPAAPMQLYVSSLGCDKNRVDSEHIVGSLPAGSATLLDDPSRADTIVVNTCCFIESATRESIEEILALAEWKKHGVCQRLVVIGCLAERYRAELLEEIPEIDLLLGTKDMKSLGRHLLPKDTVLSNGRYLSTPSHYAYLKIAEGCDKHCTYCVIPQVRGSFVSMPADVLFAEAFTLAQNGVKELILVAQETTRWGVDLYGQKSLPLLLRTLSTIDGIERIRILYAYPEEIDDALITEMASNPKICRYLDLPIQHADDGILKKMGRRTTRATIAERIGALRTAMPDICLRTTLITGFPGETEDAFDRLAEFVEEMRFDRLGVFPYSREEGTPAYLMPDQIDEETRAARAERLMERQQAIHFEKNEQRVGRIETVIVDAYDAEIDAMAARGDCDTPEVDAMVYIQHAKDIPAGTILPVRITAVHGYDVLAEPIV